MKTLSVLKYVIGVTFFFGSLGGVWSSASAQFFQGFELQVGAELPMNTQVRGKMNFPQNWFGIIGLGFSPQFMTDSYASVASGLGIHGDNTAKLVATAMSGNFSMDLRIGYEFGGNDSGPYIDFGYELSAGKGGETDMDTVEGALALDFYGIAQTAVPRVSSTVHSLVAHLGYSRRLSNSFILAFELGLIKPISSTNTATFTSNETSYSKELLDSEVSNYLSTVYQSEMIVPTASLWLSYLF
ncbi:MAG: hypothetical protein KDD35_03845 [Bdellovibrionales bacterium]|nr:hypothetical protein [Bdellovibrionales bacterium]